MSLNLDQLRTLAGVKVSGTSQINTTANINLRQQERDRDIQPGTPEWFDLWFAGNKSAIVGFRGRKK